MAKTVTRYPSTRINVLQKAAKDPKTGKARKKDPAGPFASLTWEQQRVAEQWLWKFCKRWEGNLPPWRRAILIGVAKRLAVNPVTSARARSVWRARCARAANRKAQLMGVGNFGFAAMRSRRAAHLFS